MTLSPFVKSQVVNLARNMHNARNNAGQGRIMRINQNLRFLGNMYGAQEVNRLLNVSLRGIERENARRQARRKSPSRSARVNSLTRKAAARLRKPIMNRRIAATVHQLGNILPRNVLEKIIQETRRFNSSKR
jgi:hypothetical protein